MLFVIGKECDFYYDSLVNITVVTNQSPVAIVFFAKKFWTKIITKNFILFFLLFFG